MHRAVLFTVVALLSSFGCAGDEKKPKSAGDRTGEGEAAGTEPKDSGGEGEGEGEGEAPGVVKAGTLPTECAKRSKDICLPDEKFVRRICDGDFPTAAMNLFAQGTPWKRAYLAHETDAWNASGGGSSNERLALDEEVLVLRHRDPGANPDGMQVSGAQGGYDALRWDGACVTLDASEVRFDAPDSPRNARLIWSRIEIDTREKLKEDETVRKVYIAYKNACKGVTSGDVSKECAKLDHELSETIAAYVREHGGLPTPHKIP